MKDKVQREKADLKLQAIYDIIEGLIDYNGIANYDNIKPYTIDANEIQSFQATYGELNILEKNHECPESNEHAITLMPDGTIAECPCTFL